IAWKEGHVTTIDLDEDIVQGARTALRAAGVENVQVICSDGSAGWSERAPYDRVILTVASSDIFPAWREQLIPGGYLVLPLQLIAFRSIVGPAPPAPGQLLLAFERVGDCLESIGLSCCSFIGLRGASAGMETHVLTSGPVSGLSA